MELLVKDVCSTTLCPVKYRKPWGKAERKWMNTMTLVAKEEQRIKTNHTPKQNSIITEMKSTKETEQQI